MLKPYARLKCSVYRTVTTQYEHKQQQQQQRFAEKQIQCWLCERTVRLSNKKRVNVSFKWSFYCLLAVFSLLFFSKFNCRWRRLKIYYHSPPSCCKFCLQGNFPLAIKYKSLWFTYRLPNFKLPVHDEDQLSLSKMVKYLGTIHDPKLSFKDNIVESARKLANRP